MLHFRFTKLNSGYIVLKLFTFSIFLCGQCFCSSFGLCLCSRSFLGFSFILGGQLHFFLRIFLFSARFFHNARY